MYKKLQFIHTVNGDGSKTAKHHKKAMLTTLTLTFTTIWRPPWGNSVWISSRSLALEKLEPIVQRCLRDFVLSHFGTEPACDGQTDRQTHDDSIYRASRASRGKNAIWRTTAILKTVNSATVRPIITKFGTMTHLFTDVNVSCWQLVFTTMRRWNCSTRSSWQTGSPSFQLSCY